MKTNKCILFFSGFILCPIFVNASISKNQLLSNLLTNDTIMKADSTKEEKPTHFTISLTGGNNLVQKGKKQAIEQRYIAPKLGYSFTSGIYTNLFANYLFNTPKKPLDNIGFGAGYEHSYGDHFSIDFGYSYTHYNSKKQVTSSEPNTISLSLSWSGNILTPALSSSYGFGTGSDFTNDFTLSHSFDFKKIFGKNDKLSIPLSIGASAGTSNFYREYAKNNILKKKGGKAVIPSEINTSFALTSYSFGTGITYSIKHFSISPAINYTFSTNDPSNIDLSTVPVITLVLSLSF